MKDGKFESQQERLKFLEKARDEGVYLKLETPIPCSTLHPKPCLNFATIAQAWYNPIAGWNLSENLCRKCAAGIEKLHPETEEEALPSEDAAIIAQSADPAVMNSWENEIVNQSPWRGQRDGDGE